MQSGGGGGGPGRVGPVGRASSTSSAAASPSSSSSAVSTPQLGFDPQQQQQQFGPRQAFHHQLLRKFEGNEILMAYQPGGFQAVLGGNSFSSSPVSMQVPQFPRKTIELAQQSGTSTHESQNRGQQVGDKQVPSSVHHAYMQFAAAQQKSSALLQSQQQQKLGIAMDQDSRIGNMKMPEIVSDQATNSFQTALSINLAEQFVREKQADLGQQQIPDMRNLQKSLSQTIPSTQSVSSNAVRPALPQQGSRTSQNMGNNQLALAQAMKTWALERNIDLSLPANANLMAQFVPFMQSRMNMQQKSNESGSAASLSASGPSKQPANSLTAPENSHHTNLLGDGSGKPRQGLAPCFLNSSSPSVTRNPSVSMQQPSLSGRESQGPSKPSIGLGNGVLSMHPLQVSAGSSQSPYQNIPPKVPSNCPDTPSTTQNKQFMSPPQSTASSSDANPSSSQISQTNVGFTKQQLHVLKAQILAFRRLKKGECTLPQELLRSIAPPPLESQLHPQLSTSGIGIMDKTSVEQARNLEQKEKFVQPLPNSNGPAVPKQDLFAGDEKPAISLPNINHSHAALKDSSLVNVPKIEMHKVEISDTGDQEAEQCSQKDGVRNDYNNDKGKALASDCAASDGVQAKKSQANASAQPKDSASTRKYHGPLFDFPYFTRKHDSIGSSRMVNTNNNLTLEYDIKDILCEEGSEMLNKKREENLKKINFLLAVNLERKRIRPDLVLKLEIEEKKLKLIDLQSRLRNEVDQQQQEIMAMPDRPYRKFVRLCERQRTELVRQVQATQKAAKEKQWKMIFQWRKKLLETHWAIRDARTARNRGVAKYHERILREFSKRKDDDRDKRMEALKNNDVERYREMLMEQQTSITGDAAERYAVLSSFLTQTEDYLQKLGNKIAATKNQQEVEEAANAAAAAARLQGLSEEEVKAAASCAREEVMIRNRFMEMNAPKDGSSVSKYYTLAHAVNERVTRQPSMLRAGTLRDYQLVGLQWMLSLYNNKLNGILADEMGLGKTVQVMSLIAYLMEFKGNYGPHLIIVPNAVLVNWKSEFLNWLPSVSCIFYVGGKDQRAKLFSQDVSAMKFNVLVTTYEFIMFDRSKLSKVDWKYIIIDEAQRMKDRDSVLARDLDRYRCQRRLLLTGTPLQNDLKELWSLLNLLLPEVFDNRKAFHDWFSKPFQKEGPSNDAEDDWLETEKKVIIIHRLHQILEPFMLRRRVEDVEGSLPPKVSVVLRCRMSAFQSAIYDWIKSTGTIRVDPDEEMTKLERNPMYQTKVYKPLNNRCMELRKVCNHPLLNYPYFGDLSKDFLVRSCGKLWILDRVLIKLQRTGHRVLLFSTMTKLLDILEEYLQWRRLVYRRIDGTTSLEDRESAIVDFNSRDSDCFIFLLSIRAAGRGLNLQTADTVIIYDPDPNPKNEEQAVARAHRIGQTREVKVIYMEAVVDKISSHKKEDEIRSGGSVDLEDDLAGKDRYIGSIESLIRNNIQQYKIDMADEVINAGRFDQRTTHEERRMTLETLLHDEERYQETVHDVPSLQQVNRMISRSEEEVELFDQMDEELDWIEEMTSFNQVPKWLRTSSKELNSTTASLSKKPSKKLLFANGVDTNSNDVKRARPKGKKRPNYKETDDENGDYSEEDEYSGMEEDAETREFEEDRSSGGLGVNKEQSDDGPLCGARYEYKQASQMNRAKREIDEAGSSGSSSGNVVKPRLLSPVSPKKFGSLSALDARPGSVSKKDELEEGEIAMSGDSHMEHQQSESWVLDREEGEDEQVVQPKIRRKRSIRIRPRLITERLEEKSEMSPPSFPQNRLKVNSEPKSLKEQVSFKQENDSSKLRRSFPLHKALNSPKSSRMSQLGEDFYDHSRETRDTKNSAGTSTPSQKLSDAIQRRCKNVVGKLQRKIAKEGQQIIPLLTTLWKKVEMSGSKGGSSMLDLRKMEQKVDKFEYSDVTELIYDVQLMLKGSMQYYGFSHEVRSEAKKVHDLFLDILKIAFPDTDLSEARNGIAFSAVNSSSTSTTPKSAAAPSKKPKAKDVDSDNSNQKAMPRSSGHLNAQHHQHDEVPLHPGELVICKKKRKDRDKSSVKAKMSPSSSGPFSRVSQLGGTHTQVWGNCAGGSVGWANPVKRLRTDSGKRRPHL